MQGYTGV